MAYSFEIIPSTFCYQYFFYNFVISWSTTDDPNTAISYMPFTTPCAPPIWAAPSATSYKYNSASPTYMLPSTDKYGISTNPCAYLFYFSNTDTTTVPVPLPITLHVLSDQSQEMMLTYISFGLMLLVAGNFL